MSVVFPDPKQAGFDPFAQSTWQQIVAAGQERYRALAMSEGLSFAPGLEPLYDAFAGEDITGVTATGLKGFTYLQNWLLRICPGFVDNSVNLNGFLYDMRLGYSNAPMFTVDSFMTAAGLPNGFRRVPDWDGTGIPSFQYGEGQDDDIVGYWLYEDLYACLSALKSTWYGGVFDSTVVKYHATAMGTTGSDLSSRIASQQSNWTALSEWQDGASAGLDNCPYYIQASVTDNGDPNLINARRQTFGLTINNSILSQIPCSIDFYVGAVDTPDADPNFCDMDNLGFALADPWYLSKLIKYASMPSSLQNPIITGPLRSDLLSSNPIDLLLPLIAAEDPRVNPHSPYFPSPPSGFAQVQGYDDALAVIFTFQFTNSNS